MFDNIGERIPITPGELIQTLKIYILIPKSFFVRTKVKSTGFRNLVSIYRKTDIKTVN